MSTDPTPPTEPDEASIPEAGDQPEPRFDAPPPPPPPVVDALGRNTEF